ncbi:hypothetical protein Tco_1547685, partial [Tanacetum coccineum]
VITAVDGGHNSGREGQKLLRLLMSSNST